MKVNTMRTIDRWVGIPLTFLISVVIGIYEKLFNSFSGNKSDTEQNNNLLLIELSEMGSTIIADPAMQKLQNHNKNLFFVIFKKNAKSLELLDTIKSANVFVLRDDGLFNLAIDTWRFVLWCRANKISTCIDLELFSRFTAILSALSGAKQRVGFHTHFDEGCYRGYIFNNPVRYNSHVHMAVNFLSLANTALDKNQSIYPTCLITNQELKLKKSQITKQQQSELINKIKELYDEFSLQKYQIFIINPNASDLLPQRRWQPEKFALVAKDLIKKYKNSIIILTGAPQEREYIEQIRMTVDSDRCVNSAAVFTFDDLPTLYSLARFMLTNDSGPAHFAAITNLKVFVIMGPETPNLYLPIGGNAESIYLGLPCSPCVSAFNHRKTNCTDRPCIANIDSEMVINRINKFLNKKSI